MSEFVNKIINNEEMSDIITIFIKVGIYRKKKKKNLFKNNKFCLAFRPSKLEISDKMKWEI